MGDLLDTGYRPSAEEYTHGKHWRRSVMGHTFHLPPNELQSLDFSLRSILSDTELDYLIVPLILWEMRLAYLPCIFQNDWQ